MVNKAQVMYGCLQFSAEGAEWHCSLNLYVCSHNTEKVVYFLLLDRKLRNPCKDDDEDIKAKSECGNHFHMFFKRMLEN